MKLINSTYEGSHLGVKFRVFLNGESGNDSPIKIEFDLNLLQIPNNIIIENSPITRDMVDYAMGGTTVTGFQINNLIMTITCEYPLNQLDRAEKYCHKSIADVIEKTIYKSFCVGSNTYCSFNQGTYINGYFISDEWKENNPDLYKIWKLNQK